MAGMLPSFACPNKASKISFCSVIAFVIKAERNSSAFSVLGSLLPFGLPAPALFQPLGIRFLNQIFKNTFATLRHTFVGIQRDAGRIGPGENHAGVCAGDGSVLRGDHE